MKRKWFILRALQGNER